MLTPGQTTLGNIRATARQRADIVNSQYVTDAELNGYIAASYFELYDILIQKFGNDYEVATPYQFSTVASTDTYALPSDFYKLLGVDLQLSGTPDGWLTLKPFMFIERNRYAFPNIQAAYGLRSNLNYRINGNNLWLTPCPTAGQTLRLWYIPRPTFLSDTGTITLSSVVASNTFTLNGYTFACVASGAIIDQQQFNVGGTDTITAANLASCIAAQASLGFIPSLAGVTATSSSAVVTMTAPANIITWAQISSTFSFALPDFSVSSPTAWGSIVDGVSGWEEYVVCDAAIKCMQKEESDCSILLAQKQALLVRIEAAAENRDAGSPQTVSDSRRANSIWGGGGYGGSGDGSEWWS